MELLKDYMRDEESRHMLNELTQETFWFDFEDWVTGGYYEGDYIPYSYEENGQLIANVSVNRMDFLENGVEKHYIQLGTVMTKEAYKKRGYASKLMKLIIEEYQDKCDGIYLYGNMEALGFYDKLGFSRGLQYRYFLKENPAEALQKKAKELNAEDCFLLAKGEWHKENYQNTVRNCAVNSAFEQKNKYGLQMFYTADMQQIYYSKALDCYIAMEMDGKTLFLQSVISKNKVSLEEILVHIKAEYDEFILEFTPCKEDNELFVAKEYDGEDDYRFFYLGEDLKNIETKKLYFPVFSHA